MGSTLTVRLPEDIADALQRESRESGVPKGDIVRRAVAAHLRKTAGTSVMARHFGRMGGASDLSTSKASRRAWGKKPTG